MVTVENDEIHFKQKGQAAKLDLITIKATDQTQSYIERRARGAYIASICQPGAAFDMSVAAQAQTPDEADCTLFNHRLKW